MGSNLDPENFHNSKGWHLTFGFTIWLLWKYRNQVVFNGLTFDPLVVVKQVNFYLSELNSNSFPHMQPSYRQIVIGWKPRPDEWIKLNVDESKSHQSKIAGCGGVLRGSTGYWLRGFSRNLGNCSVLLEELWGILTGLELAWELGFRNILLESDSHNAVSLLTKNHSQTHLCRAILNSIKSYLQRNWRVQVYHIYREGNVVADWLANFLISLPCGIHVFSSPPSRCTLPLKQDMTRTVFNRRILL